MRKIFIMNAEVQNNSTYRHYMDFLNAKAAAGNALKKAVERNLFEIEKRSLDSKAQYSEVINSLKHMHAMHCSLNDSDESRYIEKLLSHAQDHVKELCKRDISFNIVHFLLDKLNEDSELKFTNKEFSTKMTQNDLLEYSSDDYPFSWIGFERSGSSFLVQFKHARRIPYRTVPFIPEGADYANTIEFKGSSYNVTDPFVLSLNMPPADPSFYLLVENPGSTICFAADKIIRRYLAPRDFVTEKIKRFRITSAFSKGYVKLEGIRYILVNL
jgi:hypothetical protein